MSKRPFGSSLPILGYAIFVAAIFLFVRGYQFNTDDQAEHLPQVYQMLDPELYANDYFVPVSNSVFTVRFFYEKLVLFVAQTIGLEWGLFMLTFFCIALMAYSFSRIAEEIFGDRWSVLLAPVLAMLVFYNFTVGGNHIMYGSFISSTIAKGISAFALLLFIRRKNVWAGIVLGVATLFQPLVGLQLFLVLGGIELLFRKSFKQTFLFSVPFIALAALILVPTFVRQFGEATAYDKELYYEILYRFRNHHHYIPSLFPSTHYVKFFGLLGLGLLSQFLAKPKDNGFYVAFVRLALIGMLIYWFALEYLDVLSIGKVQWFKITVWLGAFSSIMIAGLLGQLFSGFMTLSTTNRYVLPISFFLFMLFTAAITNSRYLPDSLQHKYMVGNRVMTDLEKMHLWISENTGKDVSVLVSPVNNAFPCQAKRSMPVHFQAIVHEPSFMLPWYDDFKNIYGVSIENLQELDARKQADDLYQKRNYRGADKTIDFRIDNAESCEFRNQLGPIVHQEGNWILTRFLLAE